MTVRYTPRATRHLLAIAGHLRARSPQGMRHVLGRIRESIDLLAQFPEVGHGGALAGTREIGVPGLPYIIVHRLDPGAVTVLGVYHGAQLRPGQDAPDDDPS